MIHALPQNTLYAVAYAVLEGLKAPEEQTLDLDKLVDAIKHGDKRVVPAMLKVKFKSVRKSEIRRSIVAICRASTNAYTLYNTRTLILPPE